MSIFETYRGTGQSLFDLWRINYVGVTFVAIFFALRGSSFSKSVILALLIMGAVSVVLMAKKYSRIKRRGNKITVYTLFNKITLNEIESVDTWWDYDFGKSTADVGSAGRNTRRAHINKMNVFLEIRSKTNRIVLYEQIYMSSKFPNNHKYEIDRTIDFNKAVRVWDVDRCMKTLQLDTKTFAHEHREPVQRLKH